MTEPTEIRLLDADAPAETDVETINRWVARLGAAKAHRERLKEVYAQRISGLDSSISYLEGRVTAMAIEFRLNTGETQIPLTAGHVEVKRRPAKVEADEAAIARAGKLLGLEADPDCYTPPPATGTWRRAAVLKRLKFPAKPDDTGKAAAFDPSSGEVFEDIVKVWADEGELLVSIRTGTVNLELLQEIAEQA